jgi:hypothetical protein
MYYSNMATLLQHRESSMLDSLYLLFDISALVALFYWATKQEE